MTTNIDIFDTLQDRLISNEFEHGAKLRAAEKEFHQTLISACESETLKQTHNRIYAQFRQQLMKADRKFNFISENIRHHADILDATLAADEALTRKRIHDHLARHLTGKTLEA
jgi:DNA-binding GntR family transcriptional regulator